MSNAMDMSTPVTRGELRQELQLFRQELKQEFATKQELEEAVAKLATKQDLEVWGSALLLRMDEKFEQMEKRSLAQLASHVKAIEEPLGRRSRWSTRSTTICPAG